MNTNIVKTALDSVFYQEFNRQGQPGFVGASSPLILNQKTVDNSAEIEEVFKGSTLWSEREEEENIHYDDPRFANKITHNVVNYDKAVKISKNFFDKLANYCRSKIGLNGESSIKWIIPSQSIA